jgi:phosphoesterase RecJ-like protein
MTEILANDYPAAVKRAADILNNAYNVLIISHVSPDGDTLGSAFALCRALQKIGRKARVECSDELPAKYAYIIKGMKNDEFEPDIVVSSDIASENLFGEKLVKYKDSVALCIDHHPSNSFYAQFTLLDPVAAATCEIIYDVITQLRVEIDKDIANCIYTGLSTDTGCFRYSNTTPRTLRTAALMIEKGADAAYINKIMFETMSRQRLMAETMVMRTLEYHFDGRVAVICITREIIEQSGVAESELEGIPSVPARIEGVLAGITVKEKADGSYKISVRTNGELNASDICANFGGGGHVRAAGCSVTGSLQEIKNAILKQVKRALDEK